MVLTTRVCLHIETTHSSSHIFLTVVSSCHFIAVKVSVFVSRVKSLDTEQRAWLVSAFSFLIPKVKLTIQGQRFNDIQHGVTEILKRVSLQDSTEVAQSIGWESK